MGWDYRHVEEKINKSEIICKDFTWEDEHTKVRPLKCSVKGSTVYLAIERLTKETQEIEVLATIVLTHTNSKEHFNFGVKSMTENCGPIECDCPASILKLLTPTDSIYANEWRKKCWDNLENKKTKRKNPHSLSNLPVGAIIYMNPKVEGGEKIELEKCLIDGRKTPVWLNQPTRIWYPTTTIEHYGYEILEEVFK